MTMHKKSSWIFMVLLVGLFCFLSAGPASKHRRAVSNTSDGSSSMGKHDIQDFTTNSQSSALNPPPAKTSRRSSESGTPNASTGERKGQMESTEVPGNNRTDQALNHGIGKSTQSRVHSKKEAFQKYALMIHNEPKLPEDYNSPTTGQEERIPDPTSSDFDKLVISLSRTYDPYQPATTSTSGKDLEDLHDWCFLDSRRNASTLEPFNPKGMIFAKTFKAASSSAVGVALHLAHRLAQRRMLALANTSSRSTVQSDRINPTDQNPQPPPQNKPAWNASEASCHVFFSHEMTTFGQIFNRAQPSFLWTVVRHPGKRAVSAYHYFRSGLRSQANMGDGAIMNYLKNQKNHMTVLLRSNRPSFLYGGRKVIQQLPNSLEYAKKVLETEIMPTYDFIAIAERFDESLAVLTFLLHLEASDVVLVQDTTKSQGSWSYRTTNKKSKGASQCFWIPKSNVSEPIQNYLSTEFVEGNVDFLLYKTANSSLDLTIDRLGRRRVESRVAEIRRLRAIVTNECKGQVYPPCDLDTGKAQWEQSEKDCYFKDFGCGLQCANRVLNGLGLDQENET